MLIFLVVLIIFFPMLFGLSNYLANKKVPIFCGLLFLPAIFQIFMTPLTISQYINYFSYKIASYIILFTIIFSFIFYISFLIFKKIREIGFTCLLIECKTHIKKMYEYILISGILIISLVFIIFTYYSSDNSNNDLNYYINISKNFQYSIYSSGSVVYIENQLQNSLENYYLSPQMYYLYSVLFNDDLSCSYFLLNPLIYCTLILSITNSILDISIKNIKLWQKTIILICINFVSISSLYINVPAGNLVLQSTVLLMLLVNIKRNNYLISLIDFIPFIGLAFFSSTGMITSLISCLVLFCLVFYRKGFKKSIGYVFIPIFILFSHVEIFTNIILNKNILIILHYIIIFIAVSLYLSINYFFKVEDKKINLSIPHNNLIFLSIIILFLLTICLSLYNLLYLQTVIYEKIYFENKYSYMYLSIMLILILIYSIYWIKNNSNNNFIMIIFLINFLTTIEHITGSILTHSNSIWRLIYLLPGMGGIAETILIYFSLIICLLKLFKDFKLFKKIKSSRLFNNKFLLKTLYIIPFSLASTFSMVSSYTTLFTYKCNMSFSKNVSSNLNIVSKNDINILNELDFCNWKKTYITDIMIYQYLNNATDVTFLLNYSMTNPTRYIPSYNWNYSNFYNGIDYWNVKYTDSLIQKNSNSIINMIETVKNDISNFNIMNMYNEKILKLDYLILYKYNDYSNDVINFFKEKECKYIDGEDIIVFSF